MSNTLIPRQCESCGKIVFPKNGMFFEENRFICNKCLETEVNERNIKDVVCDVIHLLNSVGFEDIIYDNFECKLVTKTKMRQLYPYGYVVGLHTIDTYSVSERGIKDLKETIYVLNHLTEIIFREVIAHEILHSWQTRNYLNERFANDEESQKRVEGFAQMGSFLVFKDLLNHRRSKYVEEKIKSILECDDPYYGKAFKSIFQQFQSYPGNELQKWHYIIKCARKNKLNVE